MSIIGLIIVLIVVGLLIFAVQNYLPVPPMFKNLISFCLVLIAVLWLLGDLGVMNFGRVHL